MQRTNDTGLPIAPDVGTCANSKCRAPFKRLGEGRVMVFPIENPQAWGLPEHAKQKVLWLCQECASVMYVRLDRRGHTAQIVRRHHPERRAA